jgi:CheY-like chemotaxis protein
MSMDQAATPTMAAEHSQRAQEERVQILVVEDEPLIRMNMVEMLEEMGHAVWEASTAEEAIDILARTSLDILLTDVGLPGMSGIELAGQVRNPGSAMRCTC